MVEMVITDIDGTLMSEENDNFPVEIIDVLRALQEKGIAVGAATGRNNSSLRKLFGPLTDTMYFCTENGTVVSCGTDKLLHCEAVSRQAIETLFECAVAYEGADIVLGAASHSYINGKSEEFLHLMRDIKHLSVEIVHSAAEIKEDICKISVYCPDDLDGFLVYVKQRWTPDCHIVASGKSWLDFSIWNKADGVRFLLDCLKIDPVHVMYFGDNYNDLPVLEMVGERWVHDSAPADMRQRFPHHTSDVVETLKEFLASLAY